MFKYILLVSLCLTIFAQSSDYQPFKKIIVDGSLNVTILNSTKYSLTANDSCAMSQIMGSRLKLSLAPKCEKSNVTILITRPLTSIRAYNGSYVSGTPVWVPNSNIKLHFCDSADAWFYDIDARNIKVYLNRSDMSISGNASRVYGYATNNSNWSGSGKLGSVDIKNDATSRVNKN
jgi:hypothetical protein